MVKSVLLIAIVIVGLEARSTLHEKPLETINQGLNRNQENGTKNQPENTSSMPTNAARKQQYVDAETGAIIPDQKPLDEGKLGTMAPVTVEAILDGNDSNPSEKTSVVAQKSIRTEPLAGVSAIGLKDTREQGSAVKSIRIEQNEESATNDAVVAEKSARTEPLARVSAIGLKNTREQGSAIKSTRIEPSNPNEESASKISVVAQNSIRTEPLAGMSAIGLKDTREQGSAVKSTRIEAGSALNIGVVAQKSIRTETLPDASAQGIRDEVVARKSPRVESNKDNGFATKGIRQQTTSLKATRIEPVTETDENDEHGFNLPPYGPFYCTAYCVASCLDRKFGSLEACKESCATFNDNVKCADDVDCWRSCNGLLIPSTLGQLTAPKIFYNGYVQDPAFDPLSISIDWEFIDESSTYIVEFIPTPESAEAGALSVQEIVDHPWYIFKKADLCHEYYARAAAVNSNGVGKMSEAILIKAASLQISEEVAFAVLNTTITDGPTGKVALVQISYSPFDGFRPIDYAINGRVRASQCKKPVTDLFLKGDDYSADDVYFPLVHIEKSLTNYEMVIVLPEEIYSADCLYSFKPNSFVTRCGLSTDDSLPEGDASGVEFRIDANGAQLETVSSILQEENAPVCQMTGFDLTVLNTNNNGKMDVVVSWDALTDNIHETYLVHHWSNNAAQTEEKRTEMIMHESGNNKIAYYISEPLDINDLHEFQICVVSTSLDGVIDSENIHWETVPSYKVDLKNAHSVVDETNSLPMLTKIDEKKITWLILLSLLGAVTFLILASILVGKRTNCGRMKRNGMTKIYSLPDGSSVDTKILPVNSFSNPMV